MSADLPDRSDNRTGREGRHRPLGNIECGTEGLAGAGKSPSEEEILTAARALPR